jgi:RNA ligase
VTTLYDLIPEATYSAARDAGYIAVRPHPELPYLIHNYTDRATWDQAWDVATLTCRGLITTLDGEIVARSLVKFFNSDQQGAPVWPLDDEVVVMDKADGSLGILYPTPTGWAVATRGSFQSDQAVWATDLYNHRYGDFTPNPAWTYLFEIVYPENRIVVSYGDLQDLILLGAVDIATGKTVPLVEVREGWTGPVVEVFPYTTMRQVLSAPVRDNAEGFVVWHPASDARVKIKYDQYKFLHRLLTGVTPKHVWEILSSGDDPVVVFESAPDEFHGWLKAVIADLTAQYAEVEGRARSLYQTVEASLPEGWVRRDLAEAVMAATTGEAALLRPLLFLVADGRDLSGHIWKMLRPAGDTPLRLVSGDAD